MDKLKPGIEEVRADLVITDTSLDELGTKVSELLGQAFEIAAGMLATKAKPPMYVGKV